MVFFWIISCAFSLLVGLLIGGLLVVSHYDDTAPTPAEGATPINKFRAYTISFNNGRSYSVTASNVYWDKDDEWVDFVDQFGRTLAAYRAADVSMIAAEPGVLYRTSI